MTILQATQAYEQWLATSTPLIRADIRLKHVLMAETPLAFLRATFYRWMDLWPKVCRETAPAPRVLAVGDLHIENFGTWRDAEGRLIWGINDFDEVSLLPYTIDLVRLAASALLAIRQDHLILKSKTVCGAILEGYAEALRKGGEPFVMGEKHRFFLPMLHSVERDPLHFWRKMRSFRTLGRDIPQDMMRALRSVLPETELPCRFVHRIAGLGSLGKQRVVALANWHGSTIAREAKALSPSACLWANTRSATNTLHYAEVLSNAVRCPDPMVQIQGSWLLRRLAPDCCRIELAALGRIRELVDLLRAMGWETANIHLGSGESARRKILADLARRPGGWLRKEAKAMVEATIDDWKRWRSRTTAKRGKRG